MLKLYRNIKILRERMGITQDEMAQRVGYSDRTAISKIESGFFSSPLLLIIHRHHPSDQIGHVGSQCLGDEKNEP